MTGNERGERRRKVRMKLPQMVHVRPSEPLDEDFKEVVTTANASRESVYFTTRRSGYFKGLRLVVTYVYSQAPGAINREYIGEVVRVDLKERDLYGVAVRLLLPFHTHQVNPSGFSPSRRR